MLDLEEKIPQISSYWLMCVPFILSKKATISQTSTWRQTSCQEPGLNDLILSSHQFRK